MPVVVIYEPEMEQMRRDCGYNPLTEELNEANAKVAETEAQLKQTQDELEQKKKELAKAKSEITKKQSELDKANERIEDLINPKSAFVIERSDSGTVVKWVNVSEDVNKSITEFGVGGKDISGVWVRDESINGWVLNSDVVLPKSEELNAYFKFNGVNTEMNHRKADANGVITLKGYSLGLQQLISYKFTRPASANQL